MGFRPSGMANPVTRMNLSLRTYGGAVELCSRLLHEDTTSTAEYSKAATALGTLVKGPYLPFFRRRLVGEIAPDFRLHPLPLLRAENQHRDCPACGLGRKWWLFATSGSGDGWLLRAGGAEVAFLDHAEESRAKPKSLGVGFEAWLRLAVLMHDVEQFADRNPSVLDPRSYRLVPEFSAEVRARMNELGPSLDVTYPFDL